MLLTKNPITMPFITSLITLNSFSLVKTFIIKSAIKIIIKAIITFNLSLNSLILYLIIVFAYIIYAKITCNNITIAVKKKINEIIFVNINCLIIINKKLSATFTSNREQQLNKNSMLTHRCAIDRTQSINTIKLLHKIVSMAGNNINFTTDNYSGFSINTTFTSNN